MSYLGKPSAANTVWSWDGSKWVQATIASIFTPGGDLTGSATSQQVQSLTGVAGAVTVPAGTHLAFGAAPAGAGPIRLSNATAIQARNAANNENIPLVGLNASDQIEFGKYNPTTNTSLYFYAGSSGVLAMYAGTTAMVGGTASAFSFYTARVAWAPAGTAAYPSSESIAYDTSTGAEASDLATIELDDASHYTITADFETLQTGGASGAAGDCHSKAIMARYTRTGGGAPTLVVGSDRTLLEDARTLAMTYALVVSGNNVIARATNPANTNVSKKVRVSVSKVA